MCPVRTRSKTLQQTQKTSLIAANMAEKEATGKLGLLKEQNVSSTLGKQDPDQNKAKAKAKADAEFFQDSDEKNILDRSHGDLYHEAAEDADDEIDTEDGCEEFRPLSIKKVKTSKVSSSVLLSTNHPKQTNRTTAHTHHRVEWAHNLAQAQKDSAEASHTALIASKLNSPRAPTPHPKSPAVNIYPDLLRPSPPLRRRKGSMALRKKASESATAHSMMPKTGGNQDALYGHDQGHVAESSNSSNTSTTPTHRGKLSKAHGNQIAFSGEDQRNAYTAPSHRGKMAEAHGEQNAFLGEDQGNTAENDESSEPSLNLNFPFWKDKTSGLSKTYAEESHEEDHGEDHGKGHGKGHGEGHGVVSGEEGTTTARMSGTKSMTDAVTAPKASNKKKFLRKLFSRKSSKESTTSPSFSSGKTAGRKTISAPTLVDASPNAKALLHSASPLLNDSPGAKKVVNYSRPTVPPSSSNVSSGSPVERGRSGSVLRGPNRSSGPSTSPEEDGESFNPSDYSCDEGSVQRAVAVPVLASGRAKLVRVRRPRTINTAASDNQSGMGIAVTSGTPRMTDEEAMALGAQDAERYIANAMTSQFRPAATDDPFVGPAFQNLLTRPPTQRTALGGSVPTDEERAYAAALGNRHAAGQTGGQVQKKGDNTTARGQLEGYSHT